MKGGGGKNKKQKDPHYLAAYQPLSDPPFFSIGNEREEGNNKERSRQIIQGWQEQVGWQTSSQPINSNETADFFGNRGVGGRGQLETG